MSHPTLNVECDELQAGEGARFFCRACVIVRLLIVCPFIVPGRFYFTEIYLTQSVEYLKAGLCIYGDLR